MVTHLAFAGPLPVQQERKHHVPAGCLLAAGRRVELHGWFIVAIGEHPRLAAVCLARHGQKFFDQPAPESAPLMRRGHADFIDPKLRPRLVGVYVNNRRRESDDQAFVYGDGQAVTRVREERCCRTHVEGIVEHVGRNVGKNRLITQSQQPTSIDMGYCGRRSSPTPSTKNSTRPQRGQAYTSKRSRFTKNSPISPREIPVRAFMKAFRAQVFE